MWRVRLQLNKGLYIVEVKFGLFGQWRDPYFAFGCDIRVCFHPAKSREEGLDNFHRVVEFARKRNYQIEKEKALSKIKPITIRKWP